MPRYGEIDEEYGLELATTDPVEDGPVWMINLMKYRERADYGDGDDQGRSGREADDAYTPLDPLAQVGASIVYVAEVEATPIGDGVAWDRVAIVKYPTRKSFIDMQAIPKFQDLHEHKEAGMEQTFVIGSHPMEVDGSIIGTDGGTHRDGWDDLEHPPSDDDGIVHVIHVIKWNEGGRQTMEGYHEVAFDLAARHGAGRSGWFDCEGTIIGDGRSWDQVRINEFPSLAEFMEVVNDPERLEAQAEHREKAMADTYTLLCRPVVDELAASFS